MTLLAKAKLEDLSLKKYLTTFDLKTQKKAIEALHYELASTT